MANSRLAERFGRSITLTDAEAGALARLEERTRTLRRGAVLMRENDIQNDLFVLIDSTAMSYALLDNGTRQILRFLFPGDLIGLSGLAYHRAVETVAGVTNCTVACFDRATLADIMAHHPRLAAIILAFDQMDRVTLTDRLAGLGRTSAKARVAALLLEIRHSVAPADRSATPSFALGLTQEEIGDVTGLTAVHVNRMLRELEQDGLIARDNGRVTLLAERTLERIGNFVNRTIGLDLSWLPPPR